jgi:hypothetical protein
MLISAYLARMAMHLGFSRLFSAPRFAFLKVDQQTITLVKESAVLFFFEIGRFRNIQI